MNVLIGFEQFIDQFPHSSPLGVQMRTLLEGAMRAPSTHNSQPWRFHIKDTSIEVFRDERVQLPNSDKDTQYAHISIGFLLHHMYTLASYLGMQPQIVVTAREAPLARVTLSPVGTREESLTPLVRAIFARRNRRGVFKPDSIPASLLAGVQNTPKLPTGLNFVSPAVVTDRVVAKRIGELTLVTMEKVYKQPAFRAEMSRWIVPTGSSRKDGVPGYSLNQPRVMSWILPTLIRFFNIGKVPGKASAAALASAPAIFAFGSDADPAAWLSIGFEASHIILTLAANGFDASIFVATAELTDIRDEVTKLCSLNRPLRFLFATGKLEGAVSWMTPRVPISEKLIL